MAETTNKLPDADIMEKFLSAETHVERVGFFQSHPEFHTVFRKEHFEGLAEDEARVKAARKAEKGSVSPGGGTANDGAPPQQRPTGV